ncbi:unnamed protein product [Miscanthus lutarioriparius]|uniref:DUF4220 domain-containing protein n=1 Tax=Miscanthus lutarioriparius TaxID=422564 RepID=A0A811QRA9_9POAL|nr:unnamed protein product [Miscanthus lutarioriparius]
MAMARVFHLWNEWEIQILVLVSFALQVFLLCFAWMRRRSISRTLRILLWLMYLLAEFTATYTLGHMSIDCKAGEHQQLMAFWAPFLLVHLGGQDTITAYAMEDSQLWLRHLLTFTVQALGAGYVLYKYMGHHRPLVAPAVLMFNVGVLKNAERVWALSFSRLEIIRRYLDGVSIKKNDGDYPTAGTQSELDDESVLQGAHDLLYICMGQFVDDKICPTKFQNNAMKLFHEKSKTFELVELQLSLMYDIFYTKAAVIHTWYGRCFRAISLLGTAMAFFLFQFSSGKDGYSRVDAAVTYILLTGAFILEAASVLRAIGSTWTCDMLRGTSKIASFWRDGSSMIPADAKELVLKEIRRMVEACEGKEGVMRGYRGQCALERPDRCIMPDHTCRWSFPDGILKDLATWSMDMEFDESILAWHLATDEFLTKYSESADAKPLVEATKAVSNYMMFLFVERPYMLPSPVRPTLHLQARKLLPEWNRRRFKKQDHSQNKVLDPGAELAEKLQRKQKSLEMPEPKLGLLQVVFGVWVDMLCYAAHHCSRESHARQLSSGGEFLTIVWLLTTAEFNRLHYEKLQFKERVARSIWNLMNFVDFGEFVEDITCGLFARSALSLVQSLLIIEHD